MKFEDFKIGQNVVIGPGYSTNQAYDFSSAIQGKTGIVRVVRNNTEPMIGLQIPGWNKGHKLDGHLFGSCSREGWWLFEKDNDFDHVSLVSGPAESVPESKPMFPTDAKERKTFPIATGVLDYFPQALIEVARVSYIGNQQHNPGQPLHWARGKSTDQEDTIIRHFLERDGKDTDGCYHLAKAAWRILALLQLKMEADGYPVARGAKEPTKAEGPANG
jgi:hypothetical protein